MGSNLKKLFKILTSKRQLSISQRAAQGLSLLGRAPKMQSQENCISGALPEWQLDLKSLLLNSSVLGLEVVSVETPKPAHIQTRQVPGMPKKSQVQGCVVFQIAVGCCTGSHRKHVLRSSERASVAFSALMTIIAKCQETKARWVNTTWQVCSASTAICYGGSHTLQNDCQLLLCSLLSQQACRRSCRAVVVHKMEEEQPQEVSTVECTKRKRKRGRSCH